MRKLKQTLVTLLAAVLLLGTLTTAAMATVTNAKFAAMQDKGSVTITNAAAGVTYQLYRIFDISGISGDSKAAFITNEKWDTYVRAFNLGFGEFVGTGVGSAVTITNFDSDANAQALAEKVVEAANKNNIAPDATASTGASGEKLIDDLQYGFYVMVSGRQGDAVARYTTFTVMSTATVNVTEKNTKAPAIDKMVDNLHATSADFNQVLNYTVTVTAAAGTDTYTITDKLPEEITLNADSITVTKDNATLTADTDYTLTSADNGFTLTLTADFRSTLKDGESFVISYTGTLQPSTNTLTAYSNTATLIYDTDKKIADTVNVFSGRIEFEKRDNHNVLLSGAKFVVKNAEGKYAALTTADGGTGAVWYFNGWVEDQNKATVITTSTEHPTIIIHGLKSGTYTLVETEAPDGYVKGADTEVKVNKEVNGDNNNLLIGLLTERATVINTVGSTLPETGGIGTTIFYIAGALLVAAAVTLLVIKRRKHA